MGSSVGGSKVGDGFAIQCNGCVAVVDGGHPIAVSTGGDGSLVDEGDLCGPEHFKQVKVLEDLVAHCPAGNPRLVLIGIHPRAFDHAQANVNNVVVVHRKTCASRKRSAGVEAQYKDVRLVSRMPLSSHALAICFTVFIGRLAIMVDKPYEHLDKDNVGLAEVPLLEGRTDLG